MQLTIYFNGTFWCGLVEYQDSANIERVINHPFGSEPKQKDIFFFLEVTLPRLMLAVEGLAGSPLSERQIGIKQSNSKRMQRLLNKQKRQPAVSTKAQLTLQKQVEARKEAKQKRRKVKKAELKQQKFSEKQAKRLKKRKGH